MRNFCGSPITGARLFFQLMSRRYEHASTLLTSNKGFEDWGEVFGDEVMAAALVDRLVHHCHIVNIRGNSYRMRQHAEPMLRSTRWRSAVSTPGRVTRMDLRPTLVTWNRTSTCHRRSFRSWNP